MFEFTYVIVVLNMCVVRTLNVYLWFDRYGLMNFTIIFSMFCSSRYRYGKV